MPQRCRMLCLLWIAVLSWPARSQTLSGRLTNDTLIDAASSPWKIIGDVAVPTGVRLTIEAGAVLRFSKGVSLTVEGGRLCAEGTPERRIQMIADAGRWKGLRFVNSPADNSLYCIDMVDGDGDSHIIFIDRSRVLVHGCTWNPTNKTVIEVSHPSALIEDCIFPPVTEVEVVHGLYLANDEYLILRGNTFGATTGYNDIIDFSDCKRPGPILQIYDNLFLGGGDDGLDLDGTDCHIEGNVFTHFHKGHTGSSTSNAVATGVLNGKTSDIMVVRNVFWDNDHGVLLKEGCFMHAENNTFVDSKFSAVNFSEWPDRNVTPGKGAYLDGNIFWRYGRPFDNLVAQPGQANPTVVVNRSIIETAAHPLGVGNLDEDPLFVDAAGDFHLLPNSPAGGAGPNGLDMGAYVPAGASIAGEPPPVTTETAAFLTIGGPGIVAYQYAVNDPAGIWSAEHSIDQPIIRLSDLAVDKRYTVFVRGKNSAGVWQTTPPFAESQTWTVIAPSSVLTPTEWPIDGTEVAVFPNPFNSRTLISLILKREKRLAVNVFDVLGRKVRTLDDRVWPAGTHQVIFDAEGLADGIYFVDIAGDGFRTTRRLFLVK